MPAATASDPKIAPRCLDPDVEPQGRERRADERLGGTSDDIGFVDTQIDTVDRDLEAWLDHGAQVVMPLGHYVFQIALLAADLQFLVPRRVHRADRIQVPV